jgi:serine/threonine protein phosphatase PrpC
MYYKYDKVDNGTTTRPQTSFSFYLGSGNAHSSYIKYDRTAAQFNNYVLSNQTTGDLKLFAQGMGGPSIGIKFKQEVIDELRSLYKNNKAAIVSAKIRMYTDPQNWNNSLLKPSNLAIVERYKNSKGQEVSNFTNDVLGLSSVPGFTLVNSYGLDTNPGYYDITVTKTIKDIVEKNKDFSDRYLKIDIATFLLASDGVTPTGYNNTTAPYAKERVVFVGSDPSNDKKIQLKVIYGSK